MTALFKCIWTIWRRPREGDLPYKQFIGLHGTKGEALQAMQECDRMATEIEYEYIAMTGDERPKMNRWREQRGF
jgi:hypothetical protein